MNTQKKIKLLFITYTYSGGGGAEKVLTTLVNSLDAAKYEIAIQEIIDFQVKKEPINRNITLLTPLINDVYESRFSKHFTQYCIEAYPSLIRTIKNLDHYDVVVTWNYQIPSFMLRAFPDKKTIAWFHGAIDDLDLSNHSITTVYCNEMQKETWNYADRIVTISAKSLKSLENIFPEYMDKAHIIYNPFDSENTKIKAVEKIEDQYIRHNVPILICLGRLDKNKNFSLVIQAVAKLRMENILCNVLIVGDGEEKENLVHLASELCLMENVSFLGYKQNPLPYIQRADILCLSSFAEGFPTVVLESMALGKPFVTTPVAGASEELADNGNCGLVADWNVGDYAEKIKSLLIDKELYDKMSKNCVEKVKEFSVENTVRQFDNLIASLPEKKEADFQPIDKIVAIKELRHAYIWCPDFAVQRLKFLISACCVQPCIRNFALVGYYMLRLLFYIPTLPIRLFTQPALLKQSKYHVEDQNY